MTAHQLVRSSSGMIHVEGCPHVRHYVAGKRERHGGGLTVFSEVQRVDASTEIVRMVPGDSRFSEWVDARVTADGLGELGAYTRCTYCVPNVPEYDPATRYVSKEAGSLVHKDIGRESAFGRISSVTHAVGAVRVEVNGVVHELRPDERVTFAVVRSAGTRRADTP